MADPGNTKGPLLQGQVLCQGRDSRTNGSLQKASREAMAHMAGGTNGEGETQPDG